MFRQSIVITLGVAVLTILIVSFEKDFRKIYNLDVDYYWSIDIANERSAFDNTFKSDKWQSWELALLVAACGVVATIGWIILTVLQALEDKRVDNKSDDMNVFEKVSDRVTKVEQSLADLKKKMSKLTESLDKLVSTQVETIYEKDLKAECENCPSVINKCSEFSQSTQDAKIEDGEEDLSAECCRPDTPSSTEDQETRRANSVEEAKTTDRCKDDYEKTVEVSEVTVSVSTPVPVGSGEAWRGQEKRIPQYQGNRRNLHSRGKESPARAEQNAPGDAVPSRRRQRGYSQKN